MKREFLEGLDFGGTKLPKDTIDTIMSENGKDVEVVKAKYTDYDTLKTQLADANTAIAGFKALDTDGIQRAANDWKEKFEQSERDSAAKIAGMQFDSLLESNIISAKGKNAKAIRALLDLDALQASKNQSEDVKAALAAVQKDSGYLFDDGTAPPPYAPGTGATPPGTKYAPEVNTFRAAAGLKTE